MDPQGGYDSVENLRKAGNGKGRMYIVPHAGHHGKSSLRNLRSWQMLTFLCFSVFGQPQGDERPHRQGTRPRLSSGSIEDLITKDSPTLFTHPRSAWLSTCLLNSMSLDLFMCSTIIDSASSQVYLHVVQYVPYSS